MVENEKIKVYVAMSGGVDSSVAAALLVEGGYDVTGVFIRTWQPDFLPCTWREERADAIRVAVKLGIPLETFDAQDAYKKKVGDYMIEGYRSGNIPNPDVMCNREVKFGAFFEWAIKQGADFVATGHYARISPPNGEIREAQSSKPKIKKLLAGKDANKDQSYFLWTLSQDVLARTLFPIGHLNKPELRREAAKRGLHIAEKKDSQGICFLGHVDIKEFLSHYIDLKEGGVLDESGVHIGVHSGARLYTLGQRHGFTVTKKGPDDGPRYVVDRDIEANTITVSTDFKVAPEYGVREVTIQNTHWIVGEPDETKRYTARIRYRQTLQSCTLSRINEVWTVHFDELQKGVASGQSVVIYDGDKVLGGGVVVQ